MGFVAFGNDLFLKENIVANLPLVNSGTTIIQLGMMNLNAILETNFWHKCSILTKIYLTLERPSNL